MKIISLTLFVSAILFAQTFSKMPVVTNCGVAGDKITDDTATVQACIDTAPDDSEIVFPSGATMKITATINIHNRYGLLLHGQMGRFGGPSATTTAPGFYWFGPDGGKMFDYDRADNIVTESLLFFNSAGYVGGTGGASVVINVDQTLPPPGTTTANLFDRISVVSGTQNPSFQAIKFAQTSSSNVESMTVRDSFITCSYGVGVGQGIVIGPGGFYNAKRHLYQNNTITNCTTDIYLNGGSADILNNHFNDSKVNIHAVPIDPIKIDGNDSENATQFFTGPATSPVIFSDNRIDAVNPPSGQGAIWITAGGSQAVTLQGNAISPGTGIPIAFAGNAGGSLVSIGNTYGWGAATLTGFYTVPYTLTSLNDTYVSSNFSLLMSTGATGQIGGMRYDSYYKTWVLSNSLILDPNGHTLLSDPVAGLTVKATGKGTCTSGNDLSSNSTGRYLTSAATNFNWPDAGGFITITGGTNFATGDYYVGSLGSTYHDLNVTPTTGSNGFGASFVINRGRVVTVQGASGDSDTGWVCAKDSSNNYAWRQIF